MSATLFVVALLLKLLPMANRFLRMVVMAVLLATTANATADDCNANEREAFNCVCLTTKKLCEVETKDACSWASGKCSQKPCKEIDDEDMCGQASDRCKWNNAKKCQLVA